MPSASVTDMTDPWVPYAFGVSSLSMSIASSDFSGSLSLSSDEPVCATNFRIWEDIIAQSE